eukprot:3867703-Rhodomonas_salina.2
MYQVSCKYCTDTARYLYQVSCKHCTDAARYLYQVSCKYCGKKYLPPQLIMHHKFFCGPVCTLPTRPLRAVRYWPSGHRMVVPQCSTDVA